MKKELEDIKGVIMMDSQYHGEIKRTKEQTMIYKTLDRKLKIEQYKHHKMSYIIFFFFLTSSKIIGNRGIMINLLSKLPIFFVFYNVIF
jgi:acetate kinase